MYIWVGCGLPEEAEREIRRQCLALNRELGLDTAAFLLPQHISLKISFETDRAEEVLDWLESALKEEDGFYVNLLTPEQAGAVLWLPVEKNPVLERLHERLDRELEDRFGIGQHPYDKQFLFHSTLFMDADTGKLGRMKEQLRWEPRRCRVGTFWLGVSESGKAGTYRVVRRIEGKR